MPVLQKVFQIKHLCGVWHLVLLRWCTISGDPIYRPFFGILDGQSRRRHDHNFIKPIFKTDSAGVEIRQTHSTNRWGFTDTYVRLRLRVLGYCSSNEISCVQATRRCKMIEILIPLCRSANSGVTIWSNWPACLKSFILHMLSNLPFLQSVAVGLQRILARTIKLGIGGTMVARSSYGQGSPQLILLTLFTPRGRSDNRLPLVGTSPHFSASWNYKSSVCFSLQWN